MRKSLLALVPVLLLAGCGSSVGDVFGPTAGRRSTRTDVIQACNSGSLLYNADLVDTLIWATTSVWENGTSMGEVSLLYAEACEDTYGFNRVHVGSCVVCAAAVLEYVYD